VQIRKRNIIFWLFHWYWWTQTRRKTSYEQKWFHLSNVQLNDSAQRLQNLQFSKIWISRNKLFRLHHDLRSVWKNFIEGLAGYVGLWLAFGPGDWGSNLTWAQLFFLILIIFFSNESYFLLHYDILSPFYITLFLNFSCLLGNILNLKMFRVCAKS